jgi:protein gp37
MVFVCDTGDIAHPNVSNTALADAIFGMGWRGDVDWQVLTKRPERIAEWWGGLMEGTVWPTNVWLGVTAENQEQADRRIPLLLQVPAAVRFVSVEPMIGPVNLRQSCRFPGRNYAKRPLDWEIVGGETGPGARPIEAKWVGSLYAQCKAAGVPFFMKSMGDRWKRAPSYIVDWPVFDGWPVYAEEKWPREWPHMGRQP